MYTGRTRRFAAGAIALAVVVLGAGCGDPDTRTGSSQPAPAPSTQPIPAPPPSDPTGGKSISQLIAEGPHGKDSDGDGIVDAYDRFRGNDLGDEDGDGWANWSDRDPYQATVTAPQQAVTQPDAQAQKAADRQQYNQQAESYYSDNSALAETVEDRFDTQQQREPDYDHDGLRGIWDRQPRLNYSDDEDNDGESNGRDLFPRSPG